MRVLGIETSCDDTGVAIYDSELGLMANKLYSQVAMHTLYGGVVPELASRDHIRKLSPLLKELLLDANLSLADCDAIAYTQGPGLVGALMVGAAFAKSLALALGKPCIGVHHMEAHLLAPFLEADPPTFPFVALIVSGGHTLLMSVTGLGSYHFFGETLDDAAGEAFDKTAKCLGLPYPGGPAIALLAKQGDPSRFRFSRPLLKRPGLDFSFSGMKTAVLNAWLASDKSDQTRADIAAGFQVAVVDALVNKCERAMRETGLKGLVVAGGVSANQHLRETLLSTMQPLGVAVSFPRPLFSVDNGAMVAYTGCQRLLFEQDTDWAITVKARWPL